MQELWWRCRGLFRSVGWGACAIALLSCTEHRVLAADPYPFVYVTSLMVDAPQGDEPVSMALIGAQDTMGGVTTLLGSTPGGKPFRMMSWIDVRQDTGFTQRLEDEETGWWAELSFDTGITAQSWAEYAKVGLAEDGPADMDWTFRTSTGVEFSARATDNLEGYRNLSDWMYEEFGEQAGYKLVPVDSRDLILFLDRCVGGDRGAVGSGEEGAALDSRWRDLVEVLQHSMARSKDGSNLSSENTEGGQCVIVKKEQKWTSLPGKGTSVQDAVSIWGPRLTDSPPMRAFLKRHPVEPEEER